jgi:DNA-binding transcriptional regulator GbsR (MarR family)
MDMIVDFILLAASGVATIYCFVLSRRLAKLNDMKNGIGASIGSMSAALDQTQEVLALARNSSLEGVQRLTAALEDAERIKNEIDELVDALSELASASVDDVEASRNAALRAIESRVKVLFRAVENNASPSINRGPRRAA